MSCDARQWQDHDASGSPDARDVPVFSGPPVVFVAEPATFLALDASALYWTNYNGSETIPTQVRRVERTGGTPITLGSGLGTAQLAVDSTHVYWANSIGNTVKRAPKTGGTVTTIASMQAAPWGLTLSASTVLWANTDEVDDPGTQGSIRAFDKGAGTSSTVTSDPTGPVTLAVDTSTVYWLTADTLKKAPLSGSPVTVLATGLDTPAELVLSDTEVFWTEVGRVRRISKSGGTPTLVATANDPRGIAIDGMDLYVTDYGPSGKVLHVSVMGGPVTVIADNQPYPWGIVLDETNLYWANDTNRIMKLSR